MLSEKKLVVGALMLASVLLLQVPVYAQSNEDVVVPEQTPEGQPFSVSGNATILDSAMDDESKEFITITTKNNQTYFLVIDHSSATDNVYMLSMVDEDDIKNFTSDNSSGIYLPGSMTGENESGGEKAKANEDVSDPIENETTDFSNAPQTDGFTDDTKMSQTDPDHHSTMLIVISVCLFLIVMLSGYYLKVYKPQKEAEEERKEGLEDYDYSYEEEDPTSEDIYEDRDFEEEDTSEDEESKETDDGIESEINGEDDIEEDENNSKGKGA